MTRLPRHRITTMAATAVLSLIPLLLSGCEARPGTAAFVGDQRISEAHLQQVTQEWLRDPAVRKAVGTNASSYRRQVLGQLIKHEVIKGAADKLGVSVSARQIQQSISETALRLNGRAQVEAALAQAPYQLPKSEVNQFFEDFLLVSEIGRKLTERTPISEGELQKFYVEHGGPQSGQTFQQVRQRIVEILSEQRAEKYVVDYIRQTRVQVNPRYGRFDASRLFDTRVPPLLVPLRDNLVTDTTAASASPQP